jgi:hypothetical protein
MDVHQNLGPEAAQKMLMGRVIVEESITKTVVDVLPNENPKPRKKKFKEVAQTTVFSDDLFLEEYSSAVQQADSSMRHGDSTLGDDTLRAGAQGRPDPYEIPESPDRGRGVRTPRGLVDGAARGALVNDTLPVDRDAPTLAPHETGFTPARVSHRDAIPDQPPATFPPFEDLDAGTRRALSRFKVTPPLHEIKHSLRTISLSKKPEHDTDDSLAQFKRRYGQQMHVFEYAFRVPGTDATHVVQWDAKSGYVRLSSLYFVTPKTREEVGLKSTVERRVTTRLFKFFTEPNANLKKVALSFLENTRVSDDGKAGGLWLPWECARALAVNFCVEFAEALVPVFGKEFPGICVGVDAEGFGQWRMDGRIVRGAIEEACGGEVTAEDRQQGGYEEAPSDFTQLFPSRVVPKEKFVSKTRPVVVQKTLDELLGGSPAKPVVQNPEKSPSRYKGKGRVVPSETPEAEEHSTGYTFDNTSFGASLNPADYAHTPGAHFGARSKQIPVLAGSREESYDDSYEKSGSVEVENDVEEDEDDEDDGSQEVDLFNPGRWPHPSSSNKTGTVVEKQPVELVLSAEVDTVDNESEVDLVSMPPPLPTKNPLLDAEPDHEVDDAEDTPRPQDELSAQNDGVPESLHDQEVVEDAQILYPKLQNAEDASADSSAPSQQLSNTPQATSSTDKTSPDAHHHAKQDAAAKQRNRAEQESRRDAEKVRTRLALTAKVAQEERDAQRAARAEQRHNGRAEVHAADKAAEDAAAEARRAADEAARDAVAAEKLAASKAAMRAAREKWRVAEAAKARAAIEEAELRQRQLAVDDEHGHAREDDKDRGVSDDAGSSQEVQDAILDEGQRHNVTLETEAGQVLDVQDQSRTFDDQESSLEDENQALDQYEEASLMPGTPGPLATTVPPIHLAQSTPKTTTKRPASAPTGPLSKLHWSRDHWRLLKQIWADYYAHRPREADIPASVWDSHWLGKVIWGTPEAGNIDTEIRPYQIDIVRMMREEVGVLDAPVYDDHGELCREVTVKDCNRAGVWDLSEYRVLRRLTAAMGVELRRKVEEERGEGAWLEMCWRKREELEREARMTKEEVLKAIPEDELRAMEAEEIARQEARIRYREEKILRERRELEERKRVLEQKAAREKQRREAEQLEMERVDAQRLTAEVRRRKNERVQQWSKEHYPPPPDDQAVDAGNPGPGDKRRRKRNRNAGDTDADQDNKKRKTQDGSGQGKTDCIVM